MSLMTLQKFLPLTGIHFTVYKVYALDYSTVASDPCCLLQVFDYNPSRVGILDSYYGIIAAVDDDKLEGM